MHHSFSYLSHEHDYQLIVLAVAICVFGVLTAVRVLQLALASSGGRRLAWLATAALVSGGSVWAADFISILAYRPGFNIGYDLWPSVIPLGIAVGMSGLAFSAMFGRPVWIGGALFGVGIALMHYTGMKGLDIPGLMIWDARFVVLSVVFGVVFGIIGVLAIRRLPSDRSLLAGSVALAGTVLTVLYTAMSALTIRLNASASVPANEIPQALLAGGVVVSVCFVLTIVLLCVVFDGRVAKGKAEAASAIRHMAYHDPLTGLPNRAFLADALNDRLRTAAVYSHEVALLAIDFDRFKQVNDIFGHQAGDSLLRVLSDAMSAELRNGEILARVGGDEFLIVQSGLPQPAAAEDLAKRLLNAMCRDVDVEGTTFRAAASIGISLYPRDGRDAATLHPNADAALYRAKEGGRGCFRFFEPEMDLQLRARRVLQMEMRDALKRGEFKLYYQPQAGTATGVISGFEALIRWEHPKRGLIAPADFIPVAEENGFIIELGEFVLRTACAEAASWTKPLNISVNLSPVQFQHGNLVNLVRDVLAETGLEPKRLELEVTESVLILDFARAIELLGAIKALGVCIAMDDFGTGYSSLAYLQAFPFDRIKIDRSFIAALHTNKQSEAIIRAIVGLGRGLDVPITAEGVETEEQHAFLAELDCAEIQGFLIGRPQPIELLEAHIGRADAAGIKRAVA